MTGLITTFPVGGVFWDYVQYALGLEQLGFEVFYLEDTTMAPFDLDQGDYDYEPDWTESASYLDRALTSVSSSLKERWHLRGLDGRCFGLSSDEIAAVAADAELFLNVSGAGVMRDEYLPSRNKVYVDTDPGWNHFMRWPKGPPNPVDHGLMAHDKFFTYAERLGASDCPLPDLGLTWHPTRPPVVPMLWSGDERAASNAPWTTVLSWDSAPLPIDHHGVSYGTKEREFPRFEDLPRHAPAPLEIAVSGSDPPVARWRARGWSVVDSLGISRTPADYRDYLRRSRGEFSVAKHVYVATRSGWFSCRSTCYLASGRPVVVQDTGFSQHLPTGEGLFAVDGPDQALAAMRRVEDDYDTHAAAAQRLASEHFCATEVLAELCDRVGVRG